MKITLLKIFQFYFNHRIERMWRDVYEHALDLFYQMFTSLKHQGTLNPDSEIHLYALHLAVMVLELNGISHHSNSG